MLVRKPKREPAEVRSDIPKTGSVSFSCFAGVTIGTLVLNVLVLLEAIETDDFEGVAAILGMFVLLSLLVSLSSKVEDVAILGETIVVRSAFRKEKRIPIERIAFIESNPEMIVPPPMSDGRRCSKPRRCMRNSRTSSKPSRRANGSGRST
ncbi:MAG: hypothetical protein MZW92_02545 [Comamonadaceae bacterium]|nr:hypothetical protein [Comamonadaceae bacterium]